MKIQWRESRIQMATIEDIGGPDGGFRQINVQNLFTVRRDVPNIERIRVNLRSDQIEEEDFQNPVI
jgi:hypothetical protein